jgi:hypothetical protein
MHDGQENCIEVLVGKSEGLNQLEYFGFCKMRGIFLATIGAVSCPRRMVLR